MSDDEDDNLELLRSAALASIGKKQSAIDSVESDDLDQLRKEALTSRRSRNEEKTTIFEKIQPIKSGNLINLTPNTRAGEKNDEEVVNKTNVVVESSLSDVDDGHESDHGSNSSSASRSSSVSVSTSDIDEEKLSSDDSHQSPSSFDKDEEPPEEYDLVNAIDQFLDEGVIMLEQVTDTPDKKADSKEKAKANKRKSKAESGSKKKDKARNVEGTDSSMKQKKRNSRNSIRKPAERNVTIDELPSRKFTRVDNHVTDEVEHVQEREFKPKEAMWNSNDLPLREKNQTKALSASIHSSDLSFLSNVDDEQKTARPPAEPDSPDEQYKSKSDGGRFIRINKRKLDELQLGEREVNRLAVDKDSNSGDASPPHPPPGRSQRRERGLPDLREKLKQRGFHRKNRGSEKDQEQKQNDQNGPPGFEVKRIYVKPTAMYESNGSAVRKARPSFEEMLAKDKERLVVTRNMTNPIYSPLKVRLEEEEHVEDDFKSFRRKRSVVPYKPEEPPTEKQRRLEMIKKTTERKSLETKGFSDLSEDFDDFEIEEPILNSPDESGECAESSSEGETSPRETRRFVPPPPRVKPTRADLPLSDFDEDADAPALAEPRRPRRKSARELDQEEGGVVRIRSKIKQPQRDPASDNSDRQRSRIRRVGEVHSARERTASRRSEAIERFSRRREDRFREEMEPNHRSSPPRDSPRHRRKRRINVATVDEVALKKSVKHRLGLGDDEGRRFSSRPSKDFNRAEGGGAALIRRKEDRERDVDARILKISQKNAEILKRRQAIEMEEKQHRLKAS